MALIKDQIVSIITGVNRGVVEFARKANVEMFGEYIEHLIKAKEGGLDGDKLPQPLYSDNMKLGIEGMLSSASAGSISGGLEWKFIGLDGKYSKDQQQGVRVLLDREFRTVSAADFEGLKAMSVDELKKLAEVVNAES